MDNPDNEQINKTQSQTTSAQPTWAPPPPKQNGRNYLIPAALFVGCLPWVILNLVVIFGIIGATIGHSGTSSTNKHIALIRVEGEISTGRAGNGLMSSGGAGSETIIAQLEKARKNKGARGILLRVDSPGGSPAASEEIYNKILEIRKSGKPVYVSMGDLAASGGYYISSAANKIYADSNTLTGSIGVIWKTADLSRLYKMVGYSPNILKAGKYKDMNNSARAMTTEERQIIQHLVDNTHKEFISAVAAGRNKPVSQIRSLAEGCIYDGRQAKKLGLIDEIGGLEQARAAIASRCKLSSNARVIDYGGMGFIEDLFRGSEGSSERFGASFMRGAINTLTEENRGDLR